MRNPKISAARAEYRQKLKRLAFGASLFGNSRSRSIEDDFTTTKIFL